MNSSNIELTPATVVTARTDLLSTELSDTERVMLDIDKGRYFGLEEVANTIWTLVQQPITIRDVCTSLNNTYDADPHEIEADALDFIGRLVGNGLVHIDNT